MNIFLHLPWKVWSNMSGYKILIILVQNKLGQRINLNRQPSFTAGNLISVWLMSNAPKSSLSLGISRTLLIFWTNFQETDPQSTQTEQNNGVESEMDHQNSNSSNTAARFARPMESGDNVDRTNGT